MFFFRNFLNNSDITETLMGGLAYLLVIFFSITLHEYSHAFAAYKNGDLTAKDRGRLTLNPISHFDLMGTLSMLFIGFGWAKPVPINPSNFRNYKKGYLWVSAAGVLANLALASLAIILLVAFKPLFTTLTITNRASFALILLLMYLLVYTIIINLMLAMFNMLPIYPLDGYNLVNTLLPYNNKFSIFMVSYGRYILLGLIVVGLVSDMIGFPYLNIFGLFSKLAYNIVNAILA